MVFTYISGSQHEFAPLDTLHAMRLETFPTFFGIAAFLFCIHSMILPMESQMEKPKEMPLVLRYSFMIVVLLNLPFAMFGYLVFGSHTKGYVFCNLNQNTFTYVVQLALSIELMCTYPLVLSPATAIIEEYVLGHPKPESVREFMATRGVRAVLVLASFALAKLVPVFQTILSLVGGFAAASLGFVLPPLFHILARQKLGHAVTWRDRGHMLLLVFGVAAVLLTTILNIKDIVHKAHEGKLNSAGGLC